MDDDLNTSKALAVVHDLVREGNAALAQRRPRGVGGTFRRYGRCLAHSAWTRWIHSGPSTDATELHGVVDALVALALEQRAAARTRKDWAAADAVRDQLKAAGVVVEDTPTRSTMDS